MMDAYDFTDLLYGFLIGFDGEVLDCVDGMIFTSSEEKARRIAEFCKKLGYTTAFGLFDQDDGDPIETYYATIDNREER